jgi:hypothetical protein
VANLVALVTARDAALEASLAGQWGGIARCCCQWCCQVQDLVLVYTA